MVLLAGGVLLLLFLLTLYVAGYMMLITSLVGFAYPAYMSYVVSIPALYPSLAALFCSALTIHLARHLTLTVAHSPRHPPTKAIGKEESEETANVRKQWLTYWVVYSLVSLAESFLEPILAFITPVK